MERKNEPGKNERHNILIDTEGALQLNITGQYRPGGIGFMK